MATKPSTVPGWVPVGTTPSSGQKTAGFATNGPLPAGWLNWFWTLISTWIAYLRDGVIIGEAGQPGLTVTGGTGAGGKGMVVTAGGTNENGVETTATGIGSALKATTSGGVTGYAVEAVGLGNTAVRATGTGSGTVIDAANTGAGTVLNASSSAGTGYAIQATGNGTRAPFRLVPQALPSSAQTGDVCVDSGDSNKIKLFVSPSWIVIGTQS